MNISYNWLQEYITINESPQTISEQLTQLGLEVESVEELGIKGSLKGIVVGEVIECAKHPHADKLKLTKVSIGEGELLQIICGASNVAKGQKVLVALPGTTIYNKKGNPLTIQKTKIRGVESEGMLCSEYEIGVGEDQSGIKVLNADIKNGSPAADFFLSQNDTVFTIGLTPNRIDAASHYGVARDLKALTGKKLFFPNTDAFRVENTSSPIQVIVENTEACPRYSGISLYGIHIQPSPEWLQNYLNAIGIHPINNVVDITNYILHGLGQPLHAFDADTIIGNKVIVKCLPEGTPFKTLDGKERILSSEDLIICNQVEGMCIGGILGGETSKITEGTTNVFVEAAYFNPQYIRKTALKHSLKTDASFRFERGIDPTKTVEILKYAALLIKQLAGGSITSEIIDIYPQKITSVSIQMSFHTIQRLIGKNIEPDTIFSILHNLEIEVAEKTNKGFNATIPPYRVDVKQEADVIEEILRVYGYDNIEMPTHMSAGFLSEFPSKDAHKIQTHIAEFLTAKGYFEIITNSLTSSQYTALELYKKEENVSILNKLSEELDVMRQSLLFSGLEVIAHNINHRQKNLKFFEFGKVYKKTSMYEEKQQIGIFITGNKQEENWKTPSEPMDFYDISAPIQEVLSRLNIQNYSTKPTTHKAFDYGIDWLVETKCIATAGKVKTKYIKSVDIKQEVFFGEMDWEAFIHMSNPAIEYQEISRFPEVRRDLSLVVEKTTLYQDIEKIATETEPSLLKKINVFSVYEGENIPSNKKSYAISFTLESDKETLTDHQIDTIMNKLIEVFEKKINAYIRK